MVDLKLAIARTQSPTRKTRALLGRDAILRFLEKRDHLFARDSRETFQEILDGIAAFEAINQILDGHAGAGKARRAAHNLGIDFND